MVNHPSITEYRFGVDPPPRRDGNHLGQLQSGTSRTGTIVRQIECNLDFLLVIG